MQSPQKAFWCEAPKLRGFTPDLPQLSPRSYLSVYLFPTALTLTAHLFCLVIIHSNWLPVSVFSPRPASAQGGRKSTFKSWHLRQEGQERTKKPASEQHTLVSWLSLSWVLGGTSHLYGFVFQIFALAPQQGSQTQLHTGSIHIKYTLGMPTEKQNADTLEGSSQLLPCRHYGAHLIIAREARNLDFWVKFYNIKILTTNPYSNNTVTHNDGSRNPKQPIQEQGFIHQLPICTSALAQCIASRPFCFFHP